MYSDYKITANTLKANNFEVNFEYNIKDAKYWDGIYVVLLNVPKGINEFDNIYGVNSEGKVIWRIQNPIEAFAIDKNEQGYNYIASSIYVHITLSPNGIFTAITFFAMKYTFDFKTGKLLTKEVGRW